MPTQAPSHLPRLPLLFALGMLTLAVCWYLALLSFARPANLDFFGNPLGGDFAQFYFLGQAWAHDPALIYRKELQLEFIRLTFGPTVSGYWPVWYPPVVAFILVPLAQLSFEMAYAIFTLASLLASLAAVVILQRVLCDQVPQGIKHALLTLALALGFPPLLESIIGGQLAPLILLLLALSLLFLKHHSSIFAGMFLGLTLFKPTALGIFILVLALRHPKVLLGAIIPPLLALSAFYLTDNLGLLEIWFSQLANLAANTNGTRTPQEKVLSSLRLIESIGLDRSITLLLYTAITITTLFVVCRVLVKHSSFSFNHLIAVVLLTNFLLTPYLPIYDLALAVPLVFVLLKAAPSNLTLCLLVFYSAPHLAQALAQLTYIHLFPLLVLAALYYFLKSPRITSSPYIAQQP